MSQQIADIFVHLGHPVTYKKVLHLAGDRSFEAHHGIHPWRILCLDKKLRVGTILASTIRDVVVYDNDLAVIAQVDATLQRPKQRIANRQGFGQADARFTHGLPVCRFDHFTRAQTVRHGSARDTACSSALQCLDHLAPVVVLQPDVKQQVDVLFRGVDVSHHGRDGRVRILHQLRIVAAHGFEAVDRFPDLEQMRIAFRHMNLQVFRFRSWSIAHIRQPGEDLSHPFHAASADIRFTQKDVSQEANNREGDDDQYPRDARSRLTMRS